MKRKRLVRALVALGVLATAAVTVTWAATAAGTEPPAGAVRFSIVIDGVQIATFGDLGGIVSGIDPSQLDLITGQPIKLPAKRTPPTVTLSRGLTSDMSLSAWHEAALAGAAGSRKSADLVMYDFEGTPVARYHLESAWPSKLQIGQLEAGGTEVVMGDRDDRLRADSARQRLKVARGQRAPGCAGHALAPAPPPMIVCVVSELGIESTSTSPLSLSSPT